VADRQFLRAQLDELVLRILDRSNLERFLLANSRLPGPRANLELAADVTKVSSSLVTDDALCQIFNVWLTSDWPLGPAADYLPFCALMGLSGLYLDSPKPDRTLTEIRFREAANSNNWRIREAVTQALQFIGEEDVDAMMAVLNEWRSNPTLLEQRAMVATVAHPPILSRFPEFAGVGLDISNDICLQIKELDAVTRKSESLKVLVKGMGFAVSVLVAADPEAGFDFMRKWAQSGDRDITKMIAENLTKSRLAKPYPAEVAEMSRVLNLG
jgi:hypothetical protein